MKFSEVTPHINLTSGPPCVRLQSVLDHQFRIEFPSTGEKRDPSIPGARIVNPGSDNLEISLIGTKSAGTDVRPELIGDSVIRKTR